MLDGTASVDAAESIALRRALARFAAESSAEVEHIASIEVDEALRCYEAEVLTVLSRHSNLSGGDATAAALTSTDGDAPQQEQRAHASCTATATTAASMVASMLSKSMRLSATETAVATIVHQHVDVALLYGVDGLIRLLQMCDAHVPDAAYMAQLLSSMHAKTACRPTAVQQQSKCGTSVGGGCDGFLSARHPSLRGAGGNLTARRRSKATGNAFLHGTHDGQEGNQNLSARRSSARGPALSSARGTSLSSPAGQRSARGGSTVDPMDASARDADPTGSPAVEGIPAAAPTAAATAAAVDQMFVSLPIFLECLSQIKRRQFEEVIRRSDGLMEQSLRDALHSIAESTEDAADRPVDGGSDDDGAAPVGDAEGGATTNRTARGGLSEERIDSFLHSVFGLSLFKLPGDDLMLSDLVHDLSLTSESAVAAVSGGAGRRASDLLATTVDAGQLLTHLNAKHRRPLYHHERWGGGDGNKNQQSSPAVNSWESRSGGIALPRLALTRDVAGSGGGGASPKALQGGIAMGPGFDPRSPSNTSAQPTSRGGWLSQRSARTPSSGRLVPDVVSPVVAVAPSALVALPCGGDSQRREPIIVPPRGGGAANGGSRPFAVFVEDDDTYDATRRVDNGSPCGGGWSSNSSSVAVGFEPDSRAPSPTGPPGPCAWRSSTDNNASPSSPSRHSSAVDLDALRRASMVRRQQYTNRLHALTHDILEKKLRHHNRQTANSASTQQMRRSLSTLHAARRQPDAPLGASPIAPNTTTTSSSPSPATPDYPLLGGLALCPALYRSHGNENIYALGLASLNGSNSSGGVGKSRHNNTSGDVLPETNGSRGRRSRQERSASALSQRQRQTPMRCTSASIRGPQLAMQIRHQASAKLEALAHHLHAQV